MNILTIFIAAFINIFSFFSHPVHVSVCNIDYNNSSKEFNISFKIFKDDFENIIMQKYNIELNLGKNNESKNCVSYINIYIFEHFALNINNINKAGKKLLFDKFEIQDLAVWIYYKYKISKDIENVEIINSLMTDLYVDQKNLVIFTYNSTEKAFTFDNKTDTENFGILE